MRDFVNTQITISLRGASDTDWSGVPKGISRFVRTRNRRNVRIGALRHGPPGGIAIGSWALPVRINLGIRRMSIERTCGGTSLIDVLDRVLDKGIVVDAWLRVPLAGIDLITVEERARHRAPSVRLWAGGEDRC
jgi:Gas vesicle protein